MKDCILCRIASGEIPCYKIWEDDKFMAFLTPFPNTKGHSVVIPKEHHDSYFADAEITPELVSKAQSVSKLLDGSFDDVSRSGLIFDGMGVDHLHLQLVPMHGSAHDAWKSSDHEKISTFFDVYPGYISSHDGVPASTEELQSLADKIFDNE